MFPFARVALGCLLIVGLITGCGPGGAATAGGSAASPSAAVPSEAPPPASDPPPSRADDLRLLLDRLVAIHPEPFAGTTEAAFEAKLTDLAARADALSDEAFLVEVMRLLGDRDADGHTGLFPFAQTEAGLTAWPLALYAFEEGLYVVDALAPHEDAVGSRLVAIAGRPVGDVIAAVTPLVSRDNEWTARARLPGYLVIPDVLRGLGLLPEGAAILTLERGDGTRFDLAPEEIPMTDWLSFRNLFYPLVPLTLPEDGEGPRYLRHGGEFFWSEVLGEALYVGYTQVQATTASGDTINELARSIEAAFAEGTVDRVVVDIRGNPGGNNFTYPPLRDALLDRAAEVPGSVVVLIGRSTFSAAGNFATELRAEPGVRFIGEPTGGAPNLYGDAREVRLPVTGLVVHIATRTWEFAPGDEALAIQPDRLVPVRWADYAAGVDAALEAALGER